MECKKNGTVALYKNDPAYTMLKEWAGKSKEMKALFTQCLPFYRASDGMYAQ